MKVFLNNDVKEVLIQVCDLKFLVENVKMPQEIKKIINMDYRRSDDNYYVRFNDERLLNYLEKQFYILDLEKFNSLTEEEIKKEYLNNQLQIRMLLEKKKELSKKGSTDEKLDNTLNCLEYYKTSIKKYMKRQKNNKKLINK